MVWVRLDDHFDQNPKVAAVGPLGIALWVAGLAYCNRNLTDGFIPWNVARSLLSWEYLDPPNESGKRKVQHIAVSCGMTGDDVDATRVIDLLVYASLWEIDDERGGYTVHDYDGYQPTKEQIEAERKHISEVRSEAGRRSGQARREQAANKARTNTEQNTNPVPDPVPVPIFGSKDPQSTRRKRVTAITPEFLETMRAEYPDADVDEELRNAEGHKKGLGSWDDKQQGFRNWLRRGQTFRPQDQRRRPGPVVVSNGSDWEAADRARDLLPRRSG